MKTARRNVVHRIDRFLAGLDRERREPTAFEAHQVLAALGHLQVDRFPAGEDAMMRAERPDLAGAAAIAATKGAKATTAELRERLAALREAT